MEAEKRREFWIKDERGSNCAIVFWLVVTHVEGKFSVFPSK